MGCETFGGGGEIGAMLRSEGVELAGSCWRRLALLYRALLYISDTIRYREIGLILLLLKLQM